MDHGFRMESRWVSAPSEAESPADPAPSVSAVETASALLPALSLPVLTARPDYGPRPWLEYVVDLVGSEPCHIASLRSHLSDRVREELGQPELYGRPMGEEEWTFAGVVDQPEVFTELALGWNLAPREGEAPSAWELRRHTEELSRLLRPLGRRVRPRESARAAADRGAELLRLREEWDVGVVLVLRAPWLRRYDTRAIWEAAGALGLRWGQQQLLHWHNAPGRPGDELLFSLWPLEEPCSFTPEHVAAGLTVSEFALGFSIPRSPDPLGVFERMITAGRFLQARLGGKLLVGPISVASERTVQLWRSRVRLAAEQLTAAGFPPGSAKALHLF